ncbi:MAG: glycosyltransferase, partial [Chloroflexi bacterium]|nr:glycosyltransferase [Chloroflexota bacterium]
PVPVSLWAIPEMQQTVGALSRAQSFDAVVAFQSPVARYGLSFTDVPRILDVDTALCYQMRTRYLAQATLAARLRTWTSWQKAQRAEGMLCKWYDACTVVSDIERDYLQGIVRLADCRVATSPNGVDCERNHPGMAVKRPYTLIYNGALTYSANYDAMRYFLGDIYPLIRRQQPAASLTITGSTTGVDLAGLALDDSVCLSGYVDDIRPLVAGSAVCVVPLREGGGTRLKILEAMALGTPVIATSKGAEGLDVVDGEHLLLADDPSQFAALTSRLLSDEGLQRHLAAKARRLVEERYDWRAIGQRFTDLVEETVARKRSRGNHE